MEGADGADGAVGAEGVEEQTEQMEVEEAGGVEQQVTKEGRDSEDEVREEDEAVVKVASSATTRRLL